ncbi:hypothetical protein Pelo_10265 [Pelomyxa schiedti]|nr:hypothetical protein Pelo_10265 [Pelomyxa schiedti]
MFTTTSSVVARFVRGAHKFYFFARNTGQSRGYAFVDFEDRRDAEDAFERYNGYEISGRRLRLDWDVGLPKKMQVKVQIIEEPLKVKVALAAVPFTWEAPQVVTLQVPLTQEKPQLDSSEDRPPTNTRCTRQ